MKRNLKCLLILIVAASWLTAGQCKGEAVPVTVAVDPASKQANISAHFEGVSVETSLIFAGRTGKHYFDAGDHELVQVFKTLGIKSLRVGGASVDLKGLATQDDIDHLFGFAKAAGVTVIYSFPLLPLKTPADIAAVVTQARYISDHYSAALDSFSIGNEPDNYKANNKPIYSYPAYSKIWQSVFSAIRAQVPKAMFNGPNASYWANNWSNDFCKEYGSTGAIAFIAQHVYSCGKGTDPKNISNPAGARNRMLSSSGYSGIANAFVPAALKANIPYRLEETNSFWHGGCNLASNAFAASLWGLDYQYWWASQRAKGINFHTGSWSVDSGRVNAYSILGPAANGGRETLPLGYGMLAFNLGSHGQLIGATLKYGPAVAKPLNFSAYASMAPDRTIYLTLINKEHAPAARDAQVSINLPGGFSIDSADSCSLAAPAGDVAAQTGITMGGASINDDGAWSGKWTAVGIPDKRSIQITVPGASATVVRIAVR